MSNPTPAKPTPKQQRYLRDLALARGQSFTPPTTRAEASREIDRLRKAQPEARADVRRERQQISCDLARAGGATRVHDDEIAGYGSTATWGTER